MSDLVEELLNKVRALAINQNTIEARITDIVLPNNPQRPGRLSLQGLNLHFWCSTPDVLLHFQGGDRVRVKYVLQKVGRRSYRWVVEIQALDPDN